jgi:hypothetical protein
MASIQSFFNTLWLIVNDMAIGLAFGAFLLENNQVLAEHANHTTQVPSPSFYRARLKNSFFKLLLFHLPRNALYWLDAWPAGLKLNTEMSRFYANTFISVIDTWECGYLILPVVFSCLIPFYHSHSATHYACSYNCPRNAIFVWWTHALALPPLRLVVTAPHSASQISV